MRPSVTSAKNANCPAVSRTNAASRGPLHVKLSDERHRHPRRLRWASTSGHSLPSETTQDPVRLAGVAEARVVAHETQRRKCEIGQCPGLVAEAAADRELSDKIAVNCRAQSILVGWVLRGDHPILSGDEFSLRPARPSM